MRTIFTSSDIKNIISNIFKSNTEEIVLIDEDTGEQTKTDINKYLNINFYSWKNRLIEKEATPELSTFDAWVQSLNFSLNEAYALVELNDEETTASQDIDYAIMKGKVTFLIQADKVQNLDYYVKKIKNNYLGNPQKIQNANGDIIKAYILIGALMYDQEPTTIQLGECMIVSFNFSITYLADALDYNDTEIQLSLSGDDEYNEQGEIIGETKYLTMPITKATIQNIFTTNAIPTQERPDLTGFINSALSNVKTLSFYDFNKTLTMQFNDIFWRASAYRVDGILKDIGDVNIPVFVKIKSNGHSYIYKDVIVTMEKGLTNSDFNISTLTLRGWGKINI